MENKTMRCPGCGGTNITSCPGGTCYKPSQWAKDNIKYICMDCLAEFGDMDSDAALPEVKARANGLT